MSEPTITEWIRQEHAKVEELADHLYECIAVVPRANCREWLVELRDRFEHFRAHLHRHMALEERSGFMRTVLEQRPSQSDRVERLEHEHGELGRLLDSLHATLETVTPADRLLVRDCCGRIRDLLSYVQHHEDEENDLVEFVFTDDIGTKD